MTQDERKGLILCLKIEFSDGLGEGIAAGDLSRVTEAFYMADKSRSRRQGGAGLGLALCSEIAKLHGAKLEIESEPGRGTVVSVRYIGEFTERLHSGGDSDTGKR